MSETGKKIIFRSVDVEVRKGLYRDFVVTLEACGEQHYALVDFEEKGRHGAIYLVRALATILQEEIYIKFGCKGILKPKMSVSDIIGVMFKDINTADVKNVLCRAGV